MKLRRLIAVLIFLTPALTFAQATRTWISGVGDDANPCSRTAPGKTFAGAISKTAAHGEINVLDPGGFGGVTITKSITIDGIGTEGGILVAGTSGIIINAADDDVVILRNLYTNGLGSTFGSVFGINILKAGAVHIENCRITGFDKGIKFAPTSPGAQLFVNGTRIQKCKTDGIALETGWATIRDTFVTDNISSTTAGMPPVTTYLGNGIRAAAGTRMTIEGCTSAGNNYGIVADGTIYLSTSTITNNTVLGLKRTAPGTIISLRNNRIMGNAINGKVTKSIPQQ
jgi:hypothetical protein